MRCISCNIDKPLTEFYKSGKYYYSKCKECKKKLFNQYYHQNKEKLDISNASYAKEHKEEKRIYDKAYRENNKKQKQIIDKQYSIDNKVKLQKYFKEYEIINKKKLNNRRNKYAKKRRKKDINYRLTGNLRHRIWSALKGINKSKHTVELINCSVEYLKQYLESKFKKGMNWGNYGKWHIDHIRPCCSFDLSKKSEQLKCFNYKNLQPLWAIDNYRKSNKMRTI